jgi:hydrogenase maturation protease
MSATAPILVFGLGNLLLSDDGVGVHAARELQKEPVAGVTVLEIGTAILHGLSFLESDARILVIDAARGGRPPGTIYLFEARAPATSPSASSLHALGLCEAAGLLMPRGLAAPITVLGVEPASFAFGTELSAPVASVLPQVVALARETVARWRDAAARTATDQMAA